MAKPKRTPKQPLPDVTALKRDEYEAVLWHALGKVAEKERRRENLRPGKYNLDAVRVQGSFGGDPIDFAVGGQLLVGFDGETTSNSEPNTIDVLGYVLSKLNAQTRDSICRTLPDEYAENGNELPKCDALCAAMAESLLIRLRRTETKPKSGSVSCKYRLHDMARATGPSPTPNPHPAGG